MNEYHRTIVNFLRGHGARDVSLVAGGRHPHVEFLFRDKRFNLAVHGRPPGHSDAAIIKVKEIRSMLGDPDLPAPREARRLDDMTSRANGLATPGSAGGAAMYGGVGQKLRLRFFPPGDVVDLLGRSMVLVERMARDTWLLSAAPDDGAKRPVVRADGRKWQIEAGYAEELTRGYDAPFGVTPAEYVAVDGKVMVRLLTDQIRPVEVRKLRNPEGHRAPSDATTAETSPAAPENDLNPVRGAEPKMGATEVQGDEPRTRIRWTDPTMPDPRAVLAAISKVETSTPYRLTKLTDGSWVFRAPTIRLGGEC